ncbi:Na+/H+ antiporter NhaC family protein [Proteinivorax tanatarense]|uniref:Na+/H+ antiporter NhaC family protein n=1 Tax=Proteinivorax tanatarense TaxID=1260629 RepID=A0AAU7VJ70_9FIRM
MDKKTSLIISIFILTAIVASVAMGISLLFPFIISNIFCIAFLSLSGLDIKKLLFIGYKGMMECKVLYIFILLIGANISVWMASGVVPGMMYYGFEYLKETNFLFMAFVLTAFMSVFMGTAVGTISTLGIALLGVGQGFGIPEEVLLGVIVSGAFIADKVSPISGLFNLTLKATETSFKRALISMSKTLVPVVIITATIYYLLGLIYASGEDYQLVAAYQQALLEGFKISPLLLLLPVIVVLLPLKGVSIIPTILAGLIGGGIITMVYQGDTTFLQLISYTFFGYSAQTNVPELNSILISGGIAGMVEVVAIVASVITLSNILDRSGVLKPVIYDPIKKVKEKGELILKTGLIGGMLTVVTCDQTMGIVLLGKVYKPKFVELGVDKSILARTISDSSTVIAPLMPWNVNAIIIGTLTGVSATMYAPYAVLCYLFPLTVLYIFVSSKLGKVKLKKLEKILN